jgi:hypothetical protein
VKDINNTNSQMDSRSLDDEEETSFQTVIYTTTPAWTQSTPAATRTRKSSGRRKTQKRKSTAATTLYPQLSVYPDLEDVTSGIPTTSTEEFGKIAEGILEEMNARIACKIT